MRKREPISSLGLADMHIRCLPARSLPTLLFYACRLTADRLPAPQSPGASRMFTQTLRERMFESIKTRAFSLFANRHTVPNVVAGKETVGYTL